MKKRIVHLQLLPLMAGVQRFSLHLLEALPADEYDIHIISKPGGEFVDEVIRRGWNFHPVNSFRHAISPWDFVSFWEIYRIFKRENFDIVHTNSSKPGLLGRIAARLAKVPLILHTFHGSSFKPHQPKWQYLLYLWLERFANRFSDLGVFVNNSDRFQYIELGLISAEKAITIYNAMDVRAYPPLSKKQPGEDFIIGSTIRFSQQKNVINLIVAACKACHSYPKLKFIILGDGEYFELCKSIVASHRLSTRILLPGWDNEVAPWLKLFDAFVLYSRWEAMPFSIIEAMHFGLPVIGSDIPSIRELVDNEVGWVVPLDDEAALISCFGEVLNDPELLQIKGEKALVKVRELCDYETMVRAYRRVYENES